MLDCLARLECVLNILVHLAIVELNEDSEVVTTRNDERLLLMLP